MKKFLFATALILGIFVSQFVLVPQAEAAEVYAVTETQPRTGELIDYYVVTDGIQETSYGFKVRIHAVGKNSRRNKYAEFGYTKKNGEWHVVWLPSTYTTPLSDADCFVPREIFKTAQQYS